MYYKRFKILIFHTVKSEFLLVKSCGHASVLYILVKCQTPQKEGRNIILIIIMKRKFQ